MRAYRVWLLLVCVMSLSALGFAQEASQTAPRSIKTELAVFELPLGFHLEVESAEWSRRSSGGAELFLAVLKSGKLIETLKAKKSEGVKLVEYPMVRTIEGFPSMVCTISGDFSRQHRVTPTVRPTGDLLFEVDSSFFLGTEGSDSYKRLGGVKYPFVLPDGGYALAVYRYKDKSGVDHRVAAFYHPTIDPRP